ncbi:5557_t:CDS:2, partial [Funneliformis geosporum]
MTKKEDLQKELLEKVKPGAKPSDIKRLKRSKSDSDIATIPVAPPPPNHLLSDQLKEKQRELENLRKESETKSTTIRLLRESLDRDDKEQEITELKKELAQQREQIKSLSKELDATIDQANSELTVGDTEISQLRTKLERELKLARINRPSLPLKDNSLYDDNFLAKLDYFQYGLYALMA